MRYIEIAREKLLWQEADGQKRLGDTPVFWGGGLQVWAMTLPKVNTQTAQTSRPSPQRVGVFIYGTNG